MELKTFAPLPRLQAEHHTTEALPHQQHRPHWQDLDRRLRASGTL
jgi:hypothetical protein